MLGCPRITCLGPLLQDTTRSASVGWFRGSPTASASCLPLYTAPELVRTPGWRLYLWISASIENRGGVLRLRKCNDEGENNG
jgi:hypothetical protein